MGEQQIGLNGIAVKPGRLRALRPEVVKELANSMKVSGLLQPIVVRPQAGSGNGYWLVVGRHRLEAAKKLKWPSIRATIAEGMKADSAELAEIDENLIRADLSPAERAMHQARRKELYEKLHGKAKAKGANAANTTLGRNASANLADAFTADAAKKTGKSERAIQRDVTRAKKCAVLPEVVGTTLDKGDEIDALGKLSETEQQELAIRAKAGEKVSAKTRTLFNDGAVTNAAGEIAALKAELAQAKARIAELEELEAARAAPSPPRPARDVVGRALDLVRDMTADQRAEFMEAVSNVYYGDKVRLPQSPRKSAKKPAIGG